MAIVLCFPAKTNAQLIISTYAGTGAAGFSGDTGPATTAQIHTPHGVAVDAAGNVYFTDYGNHRIRKIDVSGNIRTIAGTGAPGFSGDGGPATAADLYSPRGIAVDGTGNIFFSDYVNHRIRKVTPSGIISTVAGNGFPGFGGDGGPATSAMLKYAWGVAIDGSGNLYIADQNNCRVRKVSAAGTISTIAGNGTCFIGGDGGPASVAAVQYPLGVACDATGNVYIADYGNNRIRKINPAGIISTVAGSAVFGFSGDGGPSTASQLYYPMGIAIDGPGNIYICDVNNNRIRMINTSGIISTIAGNGTAGFSGDGGSPVLASLDRSTGVAIDNTGKIYIADNNNNRIRILQPPINRPRFVNGNVQTKLSCPTENFSVDTLLAVADADAGQTESWSVVQPPLHGTLIAIYSTVSTGSTLYPTGLTYTPAIGYLGNDSFKVRVTDGIYSDTTTVHVTILDLPDAGTISGIDSLCPRDTYTFTASVPGGTWSTSNAAIATASVSGLVTGVIPGIVNINYSVTNLCGTTTATFPLLVRSFGCPAASVQAIGTHHGITVSPNPASGVVSILLSSGITEQAHFHITNILGIPIAEFSSFTNTPLPVNLNVPPGIYFISANTPHGKWAGKIIVQ